MAVVEDEQPAHHGDGAVTDQDHRTAATPSSTTETDFEKHPDDETHDKETHDETRDETRDEIHDDETHKTHADKTNADETHDNTDRAKSNDDASRGSHDADLEKGEGAEGSKEDKPGGNDPNVIWWDGDDDPQNPYNWPSWRKVVNCSIISLLTFVTPLASSIFAPGVPELMADFHANDDLLAAFVVSVYVLGFALGPLVIAPMSEIYGRTPVYHVCNVGFVAFLVACAVAPSLDALIVFRFFSGVFGSCPLTNGGGSISDMIRQEKRARAMAAFSLGPLVGPIIGPVAGGYLTAAKGWRWVFWVLTIVAGFVTVVMLLFMPETYAPTILQRKVDKLRKETGNQMLRSKLDSGLSPSDHFKRNIVRPMKMLVRSPIAALFALYIAIVYGYLYLMFTSITEVFQGIYGFSTQTAGLVYLGLGVGSLGGLAVFTITSDRHLRKMADKEGQGLKPEYRLQPLPIGALLMPAGFFIYGWAAQFRVHWIVPILGTAVIGVGNLIIFMALQMYLVDAFTLYAASALAANTVCRSVVGAILPLAGLRMYAVLGLGWGNSLLGFIGFAMLPVPFLIMKKGEWLRTRFELKNL